MINFVFWCKGNQNNPYFKSFGNVVKIHSSFLGKSSATLQ